MEAGLTEYLTVSGYAIAELRGLNRDPLLL
jgi:hypothetical protein